MRYLGLALFAEGTTDHKFLRPLLRRLCESLCAEHGCAPIEVGDVLELHSLTRVTDDERGHRIAAVAKDSAAGWHILFVHTDASGDPDAARAERIQPARDELRSDSSLDGHRIVAVVPVRETEAWAMADGDTLREVFGTNLADVELGVPSAPAEVESVPDPKSTLENAFRAAQRGRRGRRKRKAAALLEVIGERVRISVLGQVPAFALLRDELLATLADLNYL